MESDLEGYSQLTTDDEEVSDEEDSIHSEQSIEEEEPKILLEVLSPGGARLVFLLVYACCAVAIAQYAPGRAGDEGHGDRAVGPDPRRDQSGRCYDLARALPGPGRRAGQRGAARDLPEPDGRARSETRRQLMTPQQTTTPWPRPPYR